MSQSVQCPARRYDLHQAQLSVVIFTSSFSEVRYLKSQDVECHLLHFQSIGKNDIN